MNCNSQDPEWVCCTDALLPSAQIGFWGARWEEGGPGSSLALCVCSGSDQIRCLGTGLFSLSGCWERPVCLQFGPVAPKRQWVQSLQFLWGRGGRTEGSNSRGVGGTRVLISSVFMSTHYRKRRCPSDRLHGTAQTGVGGTLSPHWKCVHTFLIKNTFFFFEQVGSIKQSYFRLL